MTERQKKQLLILPLAEEARKINRILSNETSLRILESLGKNSMSAGDLAVELDVRLNTLKYNLDSLLETDLIRVKHLKWSRKGREIKVYEGVEKIIVLLPGKKNADLTSIFNLLRNSGAESPGFLEISGKCI